MTSWWRHLSIRVRLTLWYAAALSGLLALYAGGVFVFLRHSLSADLDGGLRDPGVPPVVVLHREEEQADGERERAVRLGFPHGSPEDLVGMGLCDRRKYPTQFDAELTDSVPAFWDEADQQIKAAPAVLEFDQAGNYIQGWGGPGEGYDWPQAEHGIFVDHKGYVWITGEGPEDQILKFTKAGKFVLQIGHGGHKKTNQDTENFWKPQDVSVYPKTHGISSFFCAKPNKSHQSMLVQGLGCVDIHWSQQIVAARWTNARKLRAVFS